MVVAQMLVAAVGGDLFRWELAIPDLDLIKQVKQAVMSRKFCSNPGNCQRLWGGGDNFD